MLRSLRRRLDESGARSGRYAPGEAGGAVRLADLAYRELVAQGFGCFLPVLWLMLEGRRGARTIGPIAGGSTTRSMGTWEMVGRDDNNAEQRGTRAG